MMANTDNTQSEFIQADNTSTASSMTNVVKSNDVVNTKPSQVDAPLMRYFDITDEADHSYVLGYN